MKGIDIWCASQASTDISLGMDSSTVSLGGRAIDRHNPIIRDGTRLIACSSLQPPIKPRVNQKKRFVRHSGSTRFFDGFSDSDPQPLGIQHHSDQVVVLRVSLHCKGCEGKVRKHLSRMKGVTSFNIDYAAKKVTMTVTGDVTPASVLASVCKVKSAQFWAPPNCTPSTKK